VDTPDAGPTPIGAANASGGDAPGPFHLRSTNVYESRRSPVLTTRGAVASSQPLASRIGLQILDAGGTAADAAVAVAAALQVTQPCSTGLGGDAFALYHEASSSRLYGLNGSGRCPAALTLDEARRVAEDDPLPDFHGHTVTVPGAPRAWEDLHTAFGRLTRADLMAPAIRLARDGFPVAPYTSGWWRRGAEKQLSRTEHGHELMVGGGASNPAPRAKSPADAANAGAGTDAQRARDRRGPYPGEIVRLPTLADSLQAFADVGAHPFYDGWIADRIVRAVRAAGGLLSHEDLSRHVSEWVAPIGVDYGDYTVWECPPNGQGIAALAALGIHDAARGGAETPSAPLSAGDYHLLIESMRLAFADTRDYVADPAAVPVPVEGLIDPAYLAGRAAQVDPTGRHAVVEPGVPPGTAGDDTVYFCVVDQEGNACSFINSNFMGFGTGIVPEGCGFSLQNRGRGFALDEGHPNCLAPGKRPYHTIIPGMITRRGGAGTDATPGASANSPGAGVDTGAAPTAGTPTNAGAGADRPATPDAPNSRAGVPTGPVAAAFGVMGGMMQPQGHLQVADALIRRRIDPQAALDEIRFQVADGEPNGRILFEGPGAGPPARETGQEAGAAVNTPAAQQPRAAGSRDTTAAERDTAPGLGNPGYGEPAVAADTPADPRVAGLRELGHEVEVVAGSRRALFGMGQVIWREPDGVLWCGSDPRGDGCALGQ
jgi:gamma-glutamyltranspeptidase/glutathione hydrolase